MEFMTAVVPEKQGKIVSDPSIARKLIRDGFKIIDIKPKKQFPRESVFVYEITEEFNVALEKYMREREAKRKEKKEKAE